MLEHIPEHSGATACRSVVCAARAPRRDQPPSSAASLKTLCVRRRFSTAGALSLAVILLAVGCGQEVTAPQHTSPISPQVVSGSNQPAVGAKPIEQFHDHVTESFSTEICGIPADLRIVATNSFFLYADGSSKNAGSATLTFTNPANGKSVVVSNAGQISGRAIVDEAAGTITFVTTYKGLPEKIETTNGPVLLRDAGIVAFADTFEFGTGEFISSEIIVNKGPHPEVDSDFALFCEVISSALN
jgi:hypothetical protein